MDCFKTTEHLEFQGNYGDKKVFVEHVTSFNPNGKHVIFLHGVFGSANLKKDNKYRNLAKEMTALGYSCWLVETSRISRNRTAFKDYFEWVTGSFSGKTYKQEYADVITALKEISARIYDDPLWVWGFSLGGISATLACTEAELSIDRLIIAGTGLKCRKKTEWMLKLPIISTLNEDVNLEILKKVRANSFIDFHGEFDEVFPKTACRKLFSMLKFPRGKKVYIEIPGSDHSFRTRNGKPDLLLLRQISAFADGYGKYE